MLVLGKSGWIKSNLRMKISKLIEEKNQVNALLACDKSKFNIFSIVCMALLRSLCLVEQGHLGAYHAW